jgi:hypothetical protein
MLLAADMPLGTDPVDLPGVDGGEGAAGAEVAPAEANRGRRPGRDPDTLRQDPEAVYSIDGTGNNLENPELGSTGQQLQRLASVEYADEISEPAGEDRVSPRVISNAVVAQSELDPNRRGLTDLVWIWGQFIDHDIDLTHSNVDEDGNPLEPLPIEVPLGDAFFDPFGTGEETIDFNRSEYSPETGDSVENPRQQINEITAFLDGSVVYGSDTERAEALRTFEGGRLRTSAGDLLPFNDLGLENAGGTSDSLFLAGDVRANENVALTAMHTLWVREHNRLADRIAARDPSLTDEQIFQRARTMVIAQIQAITFNEFLPALLGRNAVSEYAGYDPTVNPDIANVFSTAAYRFGHSMLSPELLRLDNNGNVIEDGNLSLRDAFFAPDEIQENGIDSLLLGAANQRAQEIDNQIVDDVRNFLFGPPGAGGFDLASLNIQRGRDHGLADYNQVRIDVGLESVASFEEITSDPELAATLRELYGDVNNIDAWVGGLAEDHVRGSSMGELFQTVLVDQFERLRDGDRFWYQNIFEGRELRRIENTTLADVIRRNTDVRGLQRNVLFDETLRDDRPRPRLADNELQTPNDRPPRGAPEVNAQPLPAPSVDQMALATQDIVPPPDEMPVQNGGGRPTRGRGDGPPTQPAGELTDDGLFGASDANDNGLAANRAVDEFFARLGNPA